MTHKPSGYSASEDVFQTAYRENKTLPCKEIQGKLEENKGLCEWELQSAGCNRESCLTMDLKIRYLIEMADFREKKKSLNILHM